MRLNTFYFYFFIFHDTFVQRQKLLLKLINLIFIWCERAIVGDFMRT